MSSRRDHEMRFALLTKKPKAIIDGAGEQHTVQGASQLIGREAELFMAGKGGIGHGALSLGEIGTTFKHTMPSCASL